MKKQFTALAVAAAMLAASTACGKSSGAAGKDYICGKIDSISGNDVVLLLAEEKSENSSDDTEEATQSSESRSSGSRSGRSRSNKAEGFSRPENGEMPSGFDSEKFSGGMPEGFSRPENGDMPSGFDSEKFSGGMPEGFSGSGSGNKAGRISNNSSYTLTGEQEEVRIPVGTDVTTLNGVKTDFEVLEKGSVIKCSCEKDSDGNNVITEVWIVE